MRNRKSDLPYSFKYIYSDGTSKVCGGTSATPEGMINDFDGLMDWDEWENLAKKVQPPAQDVVELAAKVYGPGEKNLKEVQIVNVKTGEVVVSAQVK